MSTKSTHSMVITPDESVKRFSPELESAYECLHRLLCSFLQIPDSVKSIELFCSLMKTYYYSMRNLLEADCGISQEVSDSLPLPQTGEFLKLLYSLESSEEGDVMFESLAKVDKGSEFTSSYNCWNQYRFSIFEAARILRITRARIAVCDEQSPRRYLWMSKPHLSFDDE